MKKNIILALFFIISFDVFSQESESPNIILMIGDGMGLTQITSGMYSNNNKVALEDFQYIGLSKTHSYDNLVTDSAAAGTAMSSGKKTQNYVLGLDHMGNPLKSILSICQDKGYSTALVATSNILHATPAAFFASSTALFNDPLAEVIASLLVIELVEIPTSFLFTSTNPATKLSSLPKARGVVLKVLAVI